MNAGTFFFFCSLSYPQFLEYSTNMLNSRHSTYFFNITVYEEAFGKNTQLFCKEFREFKMNVLGLLLFTCYFGYIWCQLFEGPIA